MGVRSPYILLTPLPQMLAEKMAKVEEEFSKVEQLLSPETISPKTPSRKINSRRRIKNLGRLSIKIKALGGRVEGRWKDSLQPLLFEVQPFTSRWKECKEFL